MGRFDEPDWHRAHVLRKIAACGTGLLGWGTTRCDQCGRGEAFGLPCQDRHCPGCGVERTQAWIAARKAELIDCNYFHYVFTFPGQLYPLFLENQRELYDALFDAVHETLKAFWNDPRFLGGLPACDAILHTTNRKLGFHPHVHVKISGLGINEQSGKIVRTSKPDFLFPARALAASFRGRLLTAIRRLRRNGVLTFDSPGCRPYASDRDFEALIDQMFKTNWLVDTRKIECNPADVVEYIGRYTHKTAISNSRILKLHDHAVTYSWKSNRDRRWRKRTVSDVAFVNLFRKHILPKRFRRVRYWGMLAATKKKHLLAKVQQAAQTLARLEGIVWLPKPALKTPTRPTATCSRCKGPLSFETDDTQRRPPPLFFPPTLPIPPPVIQRPPRLEAS